MIAGSIIKIIPRSPQVSSLWVEEALKAKDDGERVGKRGSGGRIELLSCLMNCHR